MPTRSLSRGHTTRSARARALSRPRRRFSLRLPGNRPGRADARRAKRPKTNAERVAETEASRFCAAVAPSIAEARIAWQTKRLAELDAQVKQRIADLEKAEAAAHEWIAKRDALLKAASDDLVAIYARMQPESGGRSD